MSNASGGVWPRVSSPGVDRISQLAAAGLLDPPATLQGRCTLDGYEVIRVLGEGGMGVVLLAHDPQSRFARDQVAIKLLNERLRGDARWVKQFLAETAHMLRLHHQRILPVLWVDREKLYYVMPYVKGADGDHWVSSAPLSNAEALRIAKQVAEAVCHAHVEQKTTHRDIKPDNVLVDCFGRAYLTDFGLGQRVDRNSSMIDLSQDLLVGSSPYMPPEALEGNADGKEWDIYSFGALLYEMLTGEPPYRGANDRDIFNRIRKGPPTPIREINRKASPELIAVAERCMARKPGDRYRSMDDVVAALERTKCRGTNAGRSSGSRAVLAAAAMIALLVGGAATMLANGWLDVNWPAAIAGTSDERSANHRKEAPAVDLDRRVVQREAEGQGRSSKESNAEETINVTGKQTAGSAPSSHIEPEPTPEPQSRIDRNVNALIPAKPRAAAAQLESDDRAKPQAAAYTNSVGMRFARVAAGAFTMGSPDDETGRDRDESQHTRRIKDSYLIGMTEVTQAQWVAVMGARPWAGKSFAREGDEQPATYVTWDQAVAFCRALSQRDSRTYRLPTEAEWEFAARAGSTTAYSFGDDANQLAAHGWHRASSGAIDAPRPVAQLNPNAFGLYDVHGNVEEWCADVFAAYPDDIHFVALSAVAADDRVVRGGSWRDRPAALRSANRFAARPSTASETIGFRVVLEVDQP